MANTHLIPIFTLLSAFLYTCLSQPTPPPPPPLNATCNGVFLSYEYTGGYRIPPTDKPEDQPFRFESTVTVLNNGRDELKSWRVFVGFQYNELLVGVSNGVLADGASLPASVGNGTFFAGFPRTDLKTAIETAGDTSQTEVKILLIGTRFGNGDPDVPLPANFTLANDGYSCPAPQTLGNTLQLCCIRELGAKPKISEEIKLQPREEGDLVIMYDVINTYDSDYWAQVTMSNKNPLVRLENWKLSWEWMRGEFIYAMKGAHPVFKDTGDCIFGDQGQQYKNMDLSQALSCEKVPTIVDLPLTRANDTDIGKIPFCCRNGTILPPVMDPSKSVSAFVMHVFKMPPDLNRTTLFPPQNWKINGTFSSDFQCGTPVAVTPSQFPDSTGLPSTTAAIFSWQVVCNATFKQKIPKCCVSFSSFYNDSVVPCSTCACGCNSNPNPTNICNANEQALLLPADALLIPFDNRTRKAKEWAKINKRYVPNPLPCGDNCGVSINWHILSDYEKGWSARITLFNWGETSFGDWSAAVELDKALTGFEKVYSFNGTTLSNFSNTIFMHGLQDFNFLIAESDGKNPRKDFRVPGSQQSVISFTKKKTPGIHVAGRDGFPTKVYFNGQECALPDILPSKGHRLSTTMAVLISLLALALLLIHR